MTWFGGETQTNEKFTVGCSLSNSLFRAALPLLPACLQQKTLLSWQGPFTSQPPQNDVPNSELCSLLSSPYQDPPVMCAVLKALHLMWVASCTNPSLIASPQRNGREGTAGPGPGGHLCLWWWLCCGMAYTFKAGGRHLTFQELGHQSLFSMSLGVALGSLSWLLSPHL